MADTIPAGIPPEGRCAFCRRRWSDHKTYEYRGWTDYPCDNPKCSQCGKKMRITEGLGREKWWWVCLTCERTRELTDKEKQEDRQ